jgi:Protein of unknown function, DUF488
MKTASWSTVLPDDHQRIGISRGVPRRQPAGFRLYRALAPGPWFNSTGTDEFAHRYRTEILAPLDPRSVVADLKRMAGDRVPVLLCYEIAGGPQWCHRTLAAEWLNDTLGIQVPEFGFESLSQERHPLMPLELRRADKTPAAGPDVTPYIGRTRTFHGELHRVIGADLDNPGYAIIGAGERTFSTAFATLARLFGEP